ncbi:hypothetical protein CB0940_08602 [Cercospora beticola]|uniref:Uncharacterized protein n=1 Tax=Cercospora beticola TaxID=122368 RepID=A0A2G5HQ86_CERBT|nr:hypothetical protein CB0940_08602 [Cercospora beticola]PIA94701.1 hypothetical protein CB0940_08602 [Cercospora beticola]WPB05179.1 hypothetical protein RHO25_009829 [Cercospora beticola]CAK1364966.1 unnamed protein product [Cercospora beticola]
MSMHTVQPDFAYGGQTSGTIQAPKALPAEPPPPYTECLHQDAYQLERPAFESHIRSDNYELELLRSYSSRATSSKSSHPALQPPIVIPQTTRSFRGPYYSPFVRAYAPDLAQHGISRSDFVSFINGLNESWVAHYAFEAVDLVGFAIGCTGPVEAMLLGAGIEVAAQLSSAATSYYRSKTFLKNFNAELFHPLGLHAEVCNTKEMLEKIEFPEGELKLEALDWDAQLDAALVDEKDKTAADAKGFSVLSEKDSCTRRMEALKDYVATLDFDVPALVRPETILSKMSATRAQRMTKRQHKKDIRKRSKTARKRAESIKGAEDAIANAVNDLRTMVMELDDMKLRKEHELAEAAGDEKKQQKISKEFEKMEKESRKNLEKTRKRLEEVDGG